MDAMTDGAQAFVQRAIKGAEPEPWGKPDMSVIQARRAPPSLPLEVFGPEWSRWITEAAEAAATRWQAEGRKVRIIRPSKPGLDFNDVLQAREAKVVAQ